MKYTLRPATGVNENSPPLSVEPERNKGMGWHAFKRFRKTWLRGQRCLEDINNFWMAHRPQTMSEVYSRLHEEVELSLEEGERVGYGFKLPEEPTAAVVPIVPKKRKQKAAEVAA